LIYHFYQISINLEAWDKAMIRQNELRRSIEKYSRKRRRTRRGQRTRRKWETVKERMRKNRQLTVGEGSRTFDDHSEKKNRW